MNPDIKINSLNYIYNCFHELNTTKPKIEHDGKIQHIVENSVTLLKNQFSHHRYSEAEKKELYQIQTEISQLHQTYKDPRLLRFHRQISNLLIKGQFSEDFIVKEKTKIKKTIQLKPAFLRRIAHHLDFKLRSFFFENWGAKIKYQRTVIKKIGLQKDILKIKNQIDHLNSLNDPKIEKIIAKLKVKLNALNKNLQTFEGEIRSYEGNLAKGEKTNFDFAKIGGERLTLTTSDNVNIDGMYLSAKVFKEKLIKMKMQEFSTKDFKLGPINHGLIYDEIEIKNENEILNTLQDLRLFSQDQGGGSGWVQLQIEGTTKILILDEREIKDFININKLKFIKGKFILPSNFLKLDQLKLQDIKNHENVQSGTIILGSGNKGIFEMNKREALAFLIRGVNVMMINYRGYGKSEGIPSEKGTYHDIEATYQYIKNNHPVSDDRIIAKGLCLGGGIMAELVRNHPEVNLFLDQTYAEYHDLIQNQLDELVKKLLKFGNKDESNILQKVAYKILSSIMGTLIRIVEPNYNTLSALKQCKGKVFVIQSREDRFTPLGEQVQMIRTMSKHNKLENIKIASLPGQHGVYWIDSEELQNSSGEIVKGVITDASKVKSKFTGRAQMDHFLSFVGMLHPIISK